jgi:hypothetical protein
MRRSILGAIAAISAASGSVRADDDPNHVYVGGQVTYAGTGGDAVPIGVEAGFRWRGVLGAHVSLAAGPLSLDGTVVAMMQFAGGFEARACTPRARACLGVRADLGYTRNEGPMPGSDADALRALLLEPMATVGVALDPLRQWEATLMGGVRILWNSLGTDQGANTGFAATFMLSRTW